MIAKSNIGFRGLTGSLIPEDRERVDAAIAAAAGLDVTTAEVASLRDETQGFAAAASGSAEAATGAAITATGAADTAVGARNTAVSARDTATAAAATATNAASATAADRVATGGDRTATATSASAAAGSATAAESAATTAGGHRTAAEAAAASAADQVRAQVAADADRAEQAADDAEDAATRSMGVVQSPLALNGHYIGRDGGAYPLLSRFFGPSDRGAWFDAAILGDVFSDLIGKTIATPEAPVARFRLHRPGTNGDVDQLAGINRVTAPAWSASNASFAAAEGPDGEPATLIRENGNSLHHNAATVTSFPTVMARAYTTSVLLKPAGRTKVFIGFGTTITASFDLSAGSVFATTPNVEAAIYPHKDGFWRCEMTCISAGDNRTAAIYLLSDAGVTPYTGDGVSGVIVADVSRTYRVQDDFLQEVPARRPRYIENANGTRCLRGDGIDDRLTAALVDLAGASQVTLAIAARQRSFGNPARAVIEHGAGITAKSFGMSQNNGGDNRSVYISTGSSDRTVHITGTPGVESDYAYVAVLDPAQANRQDQIKIYENGRLIPSGLTAAAGTVSTEAFAGLALQLFARGVSGTPVLPADADIYAGLVIDRPMSADEIVSLSRALMHRAGLPPPPSSGGGSSGGEGAAVISPVAFSEAGPVSNMGDWRGTNSFASVEFSTEATELVVDSTNTIFGSYPNLTRLGVYIDGAYYQSISPGGAGVRINTIALPPGPKLVSIVNGPQSRPSGDPWGTWVARIEGNAPLQQVIRPANRTLIYGDSISVGDAASPVMEGAWVMKLRAAMHPLSVALEGWGYRSLHEDCQTEEMRKAFVRRLMAYNPQTIWLAIGTNDYGLNRWSAAAFGAAYADLLDRIHGAMPSVRMYAQTPLIRASEGANGSGSTMADYRSQITTACSTRAWATMIDGTAILLTTDLADGVHPSTAGHAKYAAYVQGVLGW